MIVREFRPLALRHLTSCLFIVLLLGFPLTSAHAAGTSWTGIGPSGESVQVLAIDPVTPTTVYAGTLLSGIFKSTNGGVNWTTKNANLTSLNILDLAVDPATTTTLYAGTYDSGVFKSTNGGASWVAANNGLTSLRVYALAIDPATTTTLYAGTNGGVFKSSNGGANWAAALTSLSIWSLAIDPATPSTLYAGTYNGGVFKSSNGGASWVAASTGLTNFVVRTLAIDPATPATVYAGTNGGAFKSTNGGASWAAVNTGLSLTSLSIWSLAIDPVTPFILYAGILTSGIFKSLNGGASWAAVNTGLTSLNIYDLAIDPVTPSTLYAGTVDGVFVASPLKLTNDFNNDGKSDILWRNGASGLYYLYMMNGTTIASAGTIDVFADSNWQVVGTGDYDGNGTADILWRHAVLGLNKIYFMNGNTIASQGNILSVGDSNWRVVGDGDYNGDGKADILWRHAVSGQNHIWFMNGTTIASQGTVNFVPTDWQVMGSGDMDGDGKSDILWRRTSDGRNHVYLMNGNLIASQGTINTVPLDWVIAGTGDYDGDGKADILWRNSSNGRAHMYLMNGFAIASQGTVGTVPLAWEIVGDGDYNGDGKADILWRNMTPGDGRNYMYFMNGNVVIGGGLVNAVSNFNWAMVQPGYTAPLPGITVTPTSGLVTTETGDFAAFSVFLNTQPTADVTIGVNSSNTDEGDVSTTSLTFTPANWNIPQVVTVMGVDDGLDDGDTAYNAVLAPATSADTDYNGVNPADVLLININDGANTMVGGIAALTVGDVPGAESIFQSIIGADASNLEAAIGLCMVDAANLWDDPNLQAILPNLTTDGGATLPTQAEIAADLVGVPIPHNTNWARNLAQMAVNATVLQDPAFDTAHAKLGHCIGLFEGVKASGFTGQSVTISGSDVNWDVADINAVLAYMYGARGAIDWSRAYNWATDVDVDGITDTDIAVFTDASGSYEYRTVEADPAAVLNDPTFFTLLTGGAAKLASALADFRHAASMQEQFLTAMDPAAHPGRATDQTHAFSYAEVWEWNWPANLARDLQESMDLGAALSPGGFSDVVTHTDGTTSPGTLFAANAFTAPLTSAAFPSFGYKAPLDAVLSKKHNQSVAGLFLSGRTLSLEPVMHQDYGDSSMAGSMTGAFNLTLYDDRRLPTSSLLLRDGVGDVVSFGYASMGAEGSSAYIVDGFGPLSVRHVNLGTGITGNSVPLANPASGQISSWSGISVVSGSIRLLHLSASYEPIGVAVYDPATGVNTGLIGWNLPPGWVQSYGCDGSYDYMLLLDNSTFQYDVYRAPVSPAALPVTPTLYMSDVGPYVRVLGEDATYKYASSWNGFLNEVVLNRVDGLGTVSSATFHDYQWSRYGLGFQALQVFSGGNVYSLDTAASIIDVIPLPPAGDFR